MNYVLLQQQFDRLLANLGDTILLKQLAVELGTKLARDRGDDVAACGRETIKADKENELRSSQVP